jgi:hypothetical protein
MTWPLLAALFSLLLALLSLRTTMGGAGSPLRTENGAPEERPASAVRGRRLLVEGPPADPVVVELLMDEVESPLTRRGMLVGTMPVVLSRLRGR